MTTSKKNESTQHNRIAVWGGPSLTDNMYRKLGKMWACGFWDNASGQTDKQTYMQTRWSQCFAPIPGRSNNTSVSFKYLHVQRSCVKQTALSTAHTPAIPYKNRTMLLPASTARKWFSPLHFHFSHHSTIGQISRICQYPFQNLINSSLVHVRSTAQISWKFRNNVCWEWDKQTNTGQTLPPLTRGEGNKYISVACCPWWVTVSMTRGRTDGRQTVTLRFPINAVSVIIALSQNSLYQLQTVTEYCYKNWTILVELCRIIGYRNAGHACRRSKWPSRWEIPRFSW